MDSNLHYSTGNSGQTIHNILLNASPAKWTTEVIVNRSNIESGFLQQHLKLGPKNSDTVMKKYRSNGGAIAFKDRFGHIWDTLGFMLQIRIHA